MTQGWNEVAAGVFHRRYDPLDISVCVVRSDDGLLLIDTRCNPREADELITDVAQLDRAPIRWVVNTHAHYDHSFGNQRFADRAAIFGHSLVPAHYAEFERPRLEMWTADPAAQSQYDWHGVELTPPSDLIDTPTELNLGSRRVLLLPLGRGHTDTDLVVSVPDAGVWIVGDVIEQSGPPMYGSGSFPFDWPDQLDALSGLIGSDDVVIPGHGSPVDRDFVRDQGKTLRIIAEGIRESHARDEPLEYVAERLADATDFPLEIIEAAVVRGYALLA